MAKTADICLIAEGSYPYVRGGVSTWTHDLIQQHAHLSFHIVSIVPRQEMGEPAYQLPSNVLGHTIVRLHDLPAGKVAPRGAGTFLNSLEEPLSRIAAGKGTYTDYTSLLDMMKREGRLGYQWLLDSEEAWNLLIDMYENSYGESSFLDYFWSWRGLHGALYSLALAEIPEARVYHSLSTGYAGLYAARAHHETKKPVIITEHGIYTNERRIEIASANWLEETASLSLTIDHTRNNLRDLWIDSFASYSRIAYEAADEIVTLYRGNQLLQRMDGADPARMSIISNGIDYQRFSALARQPHQRPTIALIGRVVPIKDVKSYLRAVALLRDRLPEILAYVMGPMDEDRDYFEECREMVEVMGLSGNVEFTGQVQVQDYLPRIDLVVLSSLSEAMPLVLLEGGAAGIPGVATDVGACRELLEGTAEETPELGQGGIIVPLSSPGSLAGAIHQLLTEPELYASCADNLQARVATYYTRERQYEGYRSLYERKLNDGAQQRRAG